MYNHNISCVLNKKGTNCILICIILLILDSLSRFIGICMPYIFYSSILLNNNQCQVMWKLFFNVEGFSCNEYKWYGTACVFVPWGNGSRQFCYPSLSVSSSYQQICLSARLSLSGYYSQPKFTKKYNSEAINTLLLTN